METPIKIGDLGVPLFLEKNIYRKVPVFLLRQLAAQLGWGFKLMEKNQAVVAERASNCLRSLNGSEWDSAFFPKSKLPLGGSSHLVSS